MNTFHLQIFLLFLNVCNVGFIRSYASSPLYTHRTAFQSNVSNNVLDNSNQSTQFVEPQFRGGGASFVAPGLHYRHYHFGSERRSIARASSKTFSSFAISTP